MEDSRIIQLFFQRDEEAIEEVSRKYSAYCSKIVWNVLYNKEDCDECLNDVWFTTLVTYSTGQTKMSVCIYRKNSQRTCPLTVIAGRMLQNEWIHI